MKPSTNNPFHQSVESEISDRFFTLGYAAASIEYHKTMPENVVKMLQARDDVTSQLVRTRADRIAVHPSRPSWKFDAKTTTWGGSDFPIEAVPFASAMFEARDAGGNYFFACKRSDGREYVVNMAEWSTVVRVVRFKAKNEWWLNWGRGLVGKVFANCECDIMSTTNGSGDSFFVLDVEGATRDLPACPNFNEFFRLWIADTQEGGDL